MKYEKVMRSRPNGFTKGKSYLTFYGEIIGLVDEGRAVGIVYLVFSKAFDTVSWMNLIEELMIYRLGEQTVRWIEKWLNGRAHRLLFNGDI